MLDQIRVLLSCCRSSSEMNLRNAYRRARNLGYWMLNPLDRLVLRINRMGQYPPLPLRRHVSDLGSLDGHGQSFAAILRLAAGLKDGEKAWDVGCGCGMLQLGLESFQWQGEMLGTDIYKPAIRWAQKNITPRQPHFRFLHSDIQNPDYWPQGRLSAKEWFEQFPESGFDLIVAKSLFTHLLPEELDLYLKELVGRLAPSGRAVVTFFVLPQEKARYQWFKKTAPDLPYAVRNPLAPTSAVAYEEAFLREKLEACRVRPVFHRGFWSGEPNSFTAQDLFVLHKA